MLGANLGLLLYGEVSVMLVILNSWTELLPLYHIQPNKHHFSKDLSSYGGPHPGGFGEQGNMGSCFKGTWAVIFREQWPIIFREQRKHFSNQVPPLLTLIFISSFFPYMWSLPIWHKPPDMAPPFTPSRWVSKNPDSYEFWFFAFSKS